jgi:hypothetical protein
MYRVRDADGEKEDFAMGDTTKTYCKFCARSDGSMQNYAEKLKSMTGFIVRTQGIMEDAAQAVAREMMSKLPAWSNN